MLFSCKGEDHIKSSVEEGLEETTISFEESSSEISVESSEETTIEESSVEESSEEEKPKEPIIITEYEVLENPYKSLENNAKNPWDMIIFDGNLYIGAGDYDKNISPQQAYSFDLTNKVWVDRGRIPDEQIAKFITINGELMISGTDPTEDWDYGNFFKLENGKFVKYRTIKGGIHCFDMVEFNGDIFASVGLEGESFPVLISKDNGLTFENIPYKTDDGSKIVDQRVYKLFVLNQRLFALCGSKVYEYDGESFVFVYDWTDQYVRGYNFYNRIPTSVEFNRKHYFTTGYLFSFDETFELDYHPFDRTLVSDIQVINGELYILCSAINPQGGFTVSVRKSTDGENFQPIFGVNTTLPALSFALDKNTFYLGLGDVSEEDNETKGEIIYFEVEE